MAMSNSDILPSLNAHTKIILTGHSLGGAIATLAASYFVEKGVQPENIEVYTFGAPPLASKGFVKRSLHILIYYRCLSYYFLITNLLAH